MKKTLFVLCLSWICLDRSAHATIGEKAPSVDKDAAALGSVKTRSFAKRFVVDTLTSKTHTVREYLSPGGIVFAVTWKGMVHPDLSILFGERYERFKAAAENTSPQLGTAGRVVKTQDLVVELSGHMRDVEGRAYAPDLIPSKVTVEEIK